MLEWYLTMRQDHLHPHPLQFTAVQSLGVIRHMKLEERRWKANNQRFQLTVNYACVGSNNGPSGTVY